MSLEEIQGRDYIEFPSGPSGWTGIGPNTYRYDFSSLLNKVEKFKKIGGTSEQYLECIISVLLKGSKDNLEDNLTILAKSYVWREEYKFFVNTLFCPLDELLSYISMGDKYPWIDRIIEERLKNEAQ